MPDFSDERGDLLQAGGGRFDDNVKAVQVHDIRQKMVIVSSIQAHVCVVGGADRGIGSSSDLGEMAEETRVERCKVSAVREQVK